VANNPPLRDRSRFTRLPPFYNWQFVRRHPYYLEHWRAGNRHHELAARGELDRAGDADALRASVALLLGLGFRGPSYPDPADDHFVADPKQGDGLQLARPVTIRDLVEALSLAPQDLREALGRLLPAADAGHLLRDLALLQHPDLDKDLKGLVRFNENASVRSVLAAAERVIKEQKLRLGLGETRQRDDVLDGHLKVWDLREGWTGGGYDGSRERRLLDIALDLSEILPTVQSRYRAAFERVTGHPYNPNLWLKLFFRPGVKGGMSKRWTWRRKKTKRPPDPSQGDGATGREGDARLGEPVTDERKYKDLLADLRELIEKGKQNPEIIAALNMSMSEDDANQVIDYFRNRRADGLL
jgi:hypothetical protein